MKLKLSLKRATGTADLVITTDAESTVGELATALAERDPDGAGRPSQAPALTLAVLDGARHALDPSVTLANSPLQSGRVVELATAGAEDFERAAQPAATVTVLEGPDAGMRLTIPAGTAVIGRGDGCAIRLTDTFVSREHARLHIGPGIAEVADLGSANGMSLDGMATEHASLPPSARLAVGQTVLGIELLQQSGTPAGTGRTNFNRSPVVDPPYRGPTLRLPDLPERRRKQRIPMLPAMVTPLLMGLILLVVSQLSPHSSSGLGITSIAFMGMSPVMMLASALDTKWQASRGWKTATSSFHKELAALVQAATAVAHDEIRGRYAEHPDTTRCLQTVDAAAPLLWSRRPFGQRFLDVRLGVARLPSRTVFDSGASLNSDPLAQKELADTVARFASLDGAPAVIRLSAVGAFGIAGPAPRVLPLARAAITQIASLHSPAEVVIAGFFSPDNAAEWDWLKWLPHTSSPHSPLTCQHLASGEEGLALLTELEDLLDERASRDGESRTIPAVVVLVDHDCQYERARLVSLAERGRAFGVYVVWLAPRIEALPAACQAFLDLGPASPLLTLSSSDGDQVLLAGLEGIDREVAARVARLMSPMVDAGAGPGNDVTDLPPSVPWLALHGPELADQPEAVVDRWQSSRSILTGPRAAPPGLGRTIGLRALVGQGAGYPHALDLREHGPHALLGGTTGAGKSELLQSWILALATAHSPQRVTFLLVDYKGGSAFSDCVNLPHTVGLVTDLTQHLVKRALTSLGAELTHREKLLARKRAKDLLSLEATGDAETPPSLVIVVDEFAALVHEVPDFVNGVLNVAQRGRSLGLHLILATQRPAGVIKDNLRANTNLRLALRMADESDSTDVIGTSAAAHFDPASPGRAMSKTGPGRLVPFQAAYAGGHSNAVRTKSEIAIDELCIGRGREWPASEADVMAMYGEGPGPRDITRVTTTIRQAAALCELPEPRRPWLPALSSLYDLAQTPTRRRDDELVIGIVDYPERQAQSTFAFQPDRDGNLAIYGTSGSGKSTALRSLAVAAGLTARGGPCRVYGLDFGARGLRMLEELPHVGAIVAGEDRERAVRLLRTLSTEAQDRAQRFSEAKAATIPDYRRVADRPDEPRILLLVDGLTAFRQQYESLDGGRWLEALTTLMSDGRPLGIHVVVSADRANALPGRMASAVQRRIVMRLSDDNEYITLGARGILDDDSPAGRAVVDGHEMQVAVFGGRSEVLEQSLALQRLAQSMQSAGMQTAPSVDSLGTNIALASLPDRLDDLPVIGVDDDLRPAAITPRGTFAVAGPAGSGRTTLCTTIFAALGRASTDVLTFRFGRADSPAAALSWADSADSLETAAALAQQIGAATASGSLGGKSVAVLIEGFADFIGSSAEAAITELVRAGLKDNRFFVVADGSVSEFTRSLSPLGPLLRGERAGFLLQPEQAEGYGMFKVNLPRCTRDQFPPGRGYLYANNSLRLVQVAQS